MWSAEFAARRSATGCHILKEIYRSLILRARRGNERRRRNENESLKVSSLDTEEKLLRLLCKIASVTSKFHTFRTSDSPRAFGCKHIIYLPQLLALSA